MSYSAENFEPLRHTIEQASKIAISSTVNKEEREIAEKILLEFKSSKSPYDFSRYLLQHSNDSYTLFQAVSTIQDAALREWPLLATETVIAMQDFLFSYLIENQNIEKYVQKQILQTIAVFYKRTKFDNLHSNTCDQKKNSNEQKVNLVTRTIEIFALSDIKMRQIICSLLNAIITEFSNTNKSTKLGQSTESHFNSKHSFETTNSLIDSLYQSNISNICTVDQESRNLFIQIFKLIDQCFSWEFISSRHVLKNLIVPTNQSISFVLEPTPEFADFFLNPQLVQLMFRCYQLMRDDPDTAHFAIQPLILLSTLRGSVFKNDEHEIARVKFFGNFLESFVEIFEPNLFRNYESFNIASIIENVLMQNCLKHLVNVQSTFIIERFFKLTTLFLIDCFKAERMCQDSSECSRYLDSYEKILISWSNFKDSAESTELNENEINRFNLIFGNYSRQIVEAFVESRLSFREDNEVIQFNSEDCESIDNVEDSESNDLNRFKDILYSIREFARNSLDFCLPLFSRLFAEKYEQITEILKQMYQCRLSNRQVDEPFKQALAKLSEDIHWLLLINGFVLFELNESEENLIPDKIMNYQASNIADANILANLSNLLNQPTKIHNHPYSILNYINLSLIDAKIGSTLNPIVSFTFTSLQLAELENHMYCLDMLQYLSPQVGSTLAWFFRELCQSYLYMNESSYTFISPVLHQFFGPDTNSAFSILNFLIRKTLINLYIWSSENTCSTQTAKLLIDICKNRSMAQYLIQNQNFWSIGHVVTHNHEQPWISLTSGVKKMVIKSLIISCLGQFNENILNILQILNSRFEELNFNSNSYHSETKVNEVLNLVECLNGIIEATDKENLNFLISIILPKLEQSVHLLDRYHNYGEVVELIISMYHGVIEKILTQLNNNVNEHMSFKNKILESFLGLIQTFAKHNQRRKSADVNLEEDYFNDLLLFLILLNRLHNINYDNDENRFMPIEPKTNELNSSIKVIDVILIGLEFLIPLMNQEMLKFQTLSIEYFKLTSNLAFNNTDKIFSRPVDLFKTLIGSLQYGLTSSLGAEVVRFSLECIQPLCAHLFKWKMSDSIYAEALRDLFRTFFQLIFDNSIELELFDLCSNVLYSFICCFPYLFTDLVSQLIRNKFATGTELEEKIESGFKILITSSNQSNFEINLSMFNFEKRNRIKFNSKFNEFSIKTYGLLFIR